MYLDCIFFVSSVQQGIVNFISSTSLLEEGHFSIQLLWKTSYQDAILDSPAEILCQVGSFLCCFSLKEIKISLSISYSARFPSFCSHYISLYWMFQFLSPWREREEEAISLDSVCGQDSSIPHRGYPHQETPGRMCCFHAKSNSD